jgi:effector-binding domain-containing protein
MSYEIKLTNGGAILTAVIRSRMQPNELSKFVPAACGEVWSFIRAAGLPRPGRHVALYLDGGLVEVGAEVSGRFAGNDRVHCSQLPAGRVVTTTHFGPYACLGNAHSGIRRWCGEHGHQLSGVCWEIYGHWDENWNTDPSKIRTDVFHLLEEPRIGKVDPRKTW